MAPWFGPKRFGVGVGPRTWQGYLLCLAPCAMAILAAGVAIALLHR